MVYLSAIFVVGLHVLHQVFLALGLYPKRRCYRFLCRPRHKALLILWRNVLAIPLIC